MNKCAIEANSKYRTKLEWKPVKMIEAPPDFLSLKLKEFVKATKFLGVDEAKKLCYFHK